MGLKTTFKIGLILAEERIYQGKRKGDISDEEKNSIRKELIQTNLSLLPAFLVFSLVLSGSIIGTSGPPLGIFLMLLFVQLFFSTIITLTSISNFRSLRLQDPILSLPIDKEIFAITISWFLSGAFPILIMTIPPAAVYGWMIGSFLPIIIAFIWSILTVFFGHSMGLFLSNIFSFQISSNSKLGKMVQILKMSGVLVFVFIWYYLIYSDSGVGNFFEPIGSIVESFDFIYPFTAADSIGSFSFNHGILLILYSVLFVVFYLAIGNRTWNGLREPSFRISEKMEEININLRRKFEAFIRKDIDLSFRNNQIISVLIFPLIILLPNLIQVIQGDQINLITAEIVFLMSGIISAMGVVNFYVSEGKAAWIILILPISKKEFAFLKALTTSIIYPFFAVPIILIISIMSGIGIVFIILFIISSLAIAFTSGIVFSNSLSDKLPERPTVITQESFGTRLTPIITLLKSFVISSWPIVASVLIYISLNNFSISGIYNSTGLIVIMTFLIFLNLELILIKYDSLSFILGKKEE